MKEFFLKPEVIWFLIGLGLFLLELAAPGLIVLFFGIGAWITAICCMLFDISINVQMLIFISTSVITLSFLRRVLRKKYPGRTQKGTDDIEDDYVGKTATAITAFLPGQPGKVAFRGTIWEAVSSQAIVKDQQVVITGFKSIQLIVEPFTNQ